MPFDIKRAEHVRRFVEKLVYGSNEWAGQRFKLMDWQWEKIIKPLYGTVDDEGYRKYRFCYLEIPKKNGKTELAAALALYHLCADREPTPRVYSVAADKNQAAYVYDPAEYMVLHNNYLNRALTVRSSYRRIVYHKNGGIYQVLSAEVKTKHGLSPPAVFFD